MFGWLESQFPIQHMCLLDRDLVIFKKWMEKPCIV